MERRYDVIIVGAGLAGLSCGYELASRGKRILILERHTYPGGRTSSFLDQGMEVESGLHRHIGYYTALPKLLKECGVSLKEIVTWEEKVDILLPGQADKIVLGISPFWGPTKALKGILGNGTHLSPKDKLSLVPFFVGGFASYLTSQKLDGISVEEYAVRKGVTKSARKWILEPLSSGIFFLPPGEFSAYAFFGLFAPAIPKWYKMRIGIYLGGMTEVLCDPIVTKIRSLGGVVHFEKPVARIIAQGNQVIGVQMQDGTTCYATHTVVATTLPAAKEILEPLKRRKELESLFRLPTMSACTIQMELDQPALEKDITTFGPGTDMVSFSEQSRTTFRGKKGRLSIILGHPERYLHMPMEELLPMVVTQMRALGVELEGHIQAVRKVSEGNDFYSLGCGSQTLRPAQRTGIPGLILAGDYTRTSSFATMEGAVLSGKQAAKECLRG